MDNNTKLEAELLKVMSKKDNFNSYLAQVNRKRLLPNTELLLSDYEKYFEINQKHDEINWGLFYSQFAQDWHNKDLTEEQISYYKDYVFPAIEQASPEDVNTCLVGLIKKHTIEDILNNANDLNPEKLKDILNSFESKVSGFSQDSIDPDANTLSMLDFKELDQSHGIPYFLPTLQENLGSLVKGQLVVVAADFGTGKTAFVVSQAAETLKHLKKTNDKRPILYFNSEGTLADVGGKLCANLFKDEAVCGFEEIIENADTYTDKFKRFVDEEQFLLYNLLGASVEWVEQKVKKHNPALTIIDITDILAGEEDVKNLKKVYDRLRLIAGNYCPIIATTQSGDASYFDKDDNKVKNIKWLSDKHLYGSKTGKGGAADTIIAIGKDDDKDSKLRYLSTTKIKRGKQCHITCELLNQYALYRELAW